MRLEGGAQVVDEGQDLRLERLGIERWLEQGFPQQLGQVVTHQLLTDPLRLPEQGDRLAGRAALETEPAEIGLGVMPGDDAAYAGDPSTEVADLALPVIQQGRPPLVLGHR